MPIFSYVADVHPSAVTCANKKKPTEAKCYAGNVKGILNMLEVIVLEWLSINSTIQLCTLQLIKKIKKSPYVYGHLAIWSKTIYKSLHHYI
jgi:hypothetical protein